MNELLRAWFGTVNPPCPAELSGPMLWLALAGIGVGVGVVTGLFGVGGGFLVVPLLYVLLGVPYELAIGSSLCFIVGTSAAGLPGHRRAGNVDRKTVLLLAAGSMAGAILGDVVQDVLVEHVAGGDIAVFDRIMTSLFIVLLLLTAGLVFRDRPERSGGLAPLQRFRLGPRVDLKDVHLPGVSLPGLVGIGLGVGVVTGLFGVGGGVLFVPVLLLIVGLNAHKAVGTSLGVVLLASMTAVVKKGYAGEVNLPIAMALLVGSSVGVQLGVWLCLRLHAQRLQRAFALVVLLAAVMMIVDLLRNFHIAFS